MIDSFLWTSHLTPQQWRFRSRVIQAHLERLSFDELLRGGRAGELPHLGVTGSHGRGYDPNQPRVPAGHSDGGQWTSVGGPHARAIETRFEPSDQRTFAFDNSRDRVRSDVDGKRNFLLANYLGRVEQSDQASVEVQHIRSDGVETDSAWRQYAELGRLSKEDERAVEETTKFLSNVLARVNQLVSLRPGLTARLHGIAVHTEFAAAVKALNLPGIGALGVEQSFHPLGFARYGKRGSIRTDVVLRNTKGIIIAIYDVKTGDAEMRPSTKERFREYTKVAPDVQIFILRARRGQR